MGSTKIVWSDQAGVDHTDVSGIDLCLVRFEEVQPARTFVSWKGKHKSGW